MNLFPLRYLLALLRLSKAGYSMGFEGSAINEFALKTGKETLRHGVVVCIADRSHGRLHTHLAVAIAEGAKLVYWLPWSLDSIKIFQINRRFQ
ncbi:hypothetical protein SAMN05216308_11716 [Nitrosospira sp. Nsp13]|nr:hypothetical protein SAMN05216308_11716 [Nitrosospira sp. Nsp13]